jgi:hypothetical protein
MSERMTTSKPVQGTDHRNLGAHTIEQKDEGRGIFPEGKALLPGAEHTRKPDLLSMQQLVVNWAIVQAFLEGEMTISDAIAHTNADPGYKGNVAGVHDTAGVEVDG